MKVSHIGIAVRSLEEAGRSWLELLQSDDAHHELVEEQGVEVLSFPVGDVLIELTAPTREDSPIEKFISKRGEGIHHIAIEVDDLAERLDRLEKLGVRLIDSTPRSGAHGMQIAFLHPSSFHGVLVELCQKSTETAKGLK